MEKHLLRDGLFIISECYSNYEIPSTEVLDFIYTQFEEYDNELFMLGIKEVIRTITVKPTFAHIHTAIQNIALSMAKSPEEMFESLRYNIRQYGRNKLTEAKKHMNKVMVKTVEETGGYLSYCNMTEADKPYKRKEFIAIYKRNIEVEIRNDSKLLNQVYLRGKQNDKQLESQINRLQIKQNTQTE